MIFDAPSKIVTQTTEQVEEAVQISAQASTVSPAVASSSNLEDDSSSLDEFRGSDMEDNGNRQKVK